jgi:hypothetical protein
MRWERARWIRSVLLSLSLVACQGAEQPREVATAQPSRSPPALPPLPPISDKWTPETNVARGECWVRWRPLTSRQMKRVKDEVEQRRNGWRATRINRFTGVVETLVCRQTCNAIDPGKSDEEVRHNKVAALWTNADLFGLKPADVRRIKWKAHPTLSDREVARAGLSMQGSIRCDNTATNELRGSDECWTINVTFAHGSGLGVVEVRRWAPWVDPCLTPRVTMEQARHRPVVGGRAVGPNDVQEARLSLSSQQTDAELTWRLVWDVRVFRTSSALIDAVNGETVGVVSRVIE